MARNTGSRSFLLGPRRSDSGLSRLGQLCCGCVRRATPGLNQYGASQPVRVAFAQIRRHPSNRQSGEADGRAQHPRVRGAILGDLPDPLRGHWRRPCSSICRRLGAGGLHSGVKEQEAARARRDAKTDDGSHPGNLASAGYRRKTPLATSCASPLGGTCARSPGSGWLVHVPPLSPNLIRLSEGDSMTEVERTGGLRSV